MNFEPCNPPLMDPLYLTGVTLLSEDRKPIIFLQQDLKITLFPEDKKKTYPVRPFPVRSEVTSSAQSMTSSYKLAPLTRGNVAPASIDVTYAPIRQTLASETSHSNTISNISSIFSPKITVSSSVHNSEQIFVQPGPSPDTTPPKPANTNLSLGSYYEVIATQSNARKISPVHTLKKKSPKSRSGSSSPYSSPNTSPDSTPTTSCTRNGKKIERHGISESQVAILKIWFSRNNYLSWEERSLVSRETGLPEKTVMYWFQNQRRRVKKEHKGLG